MEAENRSLQLRGSKSDTRMSKAHGILSSMNLLDQSANESSFGRLTPQASVSMSRFGAFSDSFNASYQSASYSDIALNNTVAANESLKFGAGLVKDVADSEPIYAAYMALFSDFKEISNENGYGDLMELASMYEQLCVKCGTHIENLLNEMQDGPGRHTALHMIKLLKFEKQTWRLVVSLYKDRIASNHDGSQMDAEETNGDLQYQSEKELVQDYLDSDNQVRQAQIVVDWLEQNAADDLDAHVEKADQYMSGVMWENSLYQLKKSKECGEKPHPKYASEMDPDAPTRQKRTLLDLDLQDEAELLNAIHACIRAGRIHEAQDLCVTHGQAWRAATLEGWRLYHDPNFFSTSDEYVVTEGNPTRTMWKSTCWALSHNCNYSTKERAVYGALSGNLSAMLDDCTKWEDCVWAYYKTLLDVSVEKKLMEAPNARVPIQRRHLMKLSNALNLPERFWSQKVSLNEQDKIFDTIAASHSTEVRVQAKHPYNVTQRCIILNSISKLVEEMMTWVEGDEFDPQILRFSTHLLLFFRDLGDGIDMEHFNTIMHKYVTFLSSDFRTSSLVASYCSSLPEQQQVSSYADLLEPIEDPVQRRQFFELAADAGLQINDITKTVVDRIRAGDAGYESSSFASLLKPQGDHPDIEQTATAKDMKKIKSLEWLVIDPAQRFEAVYQCNAVMRTFLGAGKFQAASEAYDMLPEDSIDLVYREWQAKTDVDVPLPARCDNAINERICIVSYLEAQVAFRNWFKHFHSDKPKVSSDLANESSLTSVSFQPLAGNVSLTNIVAGELQESKNKEKLREWNERLMMFCNVATEKIYNVLLFPEGWLVDKREVDTHDVNGEDEMRHRQMALLRQLCIPMLCNLLLTVLRNTEGKSFDCTKLADVVADENTRVYELFSKAEGKKFFSKIQDILIDCI